MGRIGFSPIKKSSMKPPAVQAVTVATVVYIPELSGYWTESLDVLKLCLKSMRESTEVPFDLMVFDNASCGIVKHYLQEEVENGNIQSLITASRNYGKDYALNYLMLAAPGCIISFCDSDVFFLKDWLKESISIVDAYPDVGMVTAQPIINAKSIHQLTFGLAANDEGTRIVSTGNLVDANMIIAFNHSVGRVPLSYDEYSSQIERYDTLLERDGCLAFVGASHFQFTMSRQNADKIFPIAVRDLLKVESFDEKIASLGLWRLSTPKYLVHHLGNDARSYTSELKLVYPGSNIDAQSANGSTTTNPRTARMASRGMVRRVLKYIYNWLFNVLYNT